MDPIMICLVLLILCLFIMFGIGEVSSKLMLSWEWLLL